MSDSESDQPLAGSRPSDCDLTKALRDVVGDVFASGKMEELTVKRVRLAAEKKLKIEEGFFKGDGEWKARSDQVIKDEVVSDLRAMGTIVLFHGANVARVIYRKQENRKSRLSLRPNLPLPRQSDPVRERHPSRESVRKQRPQTPRMRMEPRTMKSKGIMMTMTKRR